MLARHSWIVLTTLAAIVAVAPACSSPGPTSSSAAPGGASTAPRAHGVYEQCLADHGVPAAGLRPPSGTVPTPAGPPPGPPPEGAPATPPPPPGIDQGTWHNAISACTSLAPAPPAGNR